VVDDGSTDDTRAVADGFSNVACWFKNQRPEERRDLCRRLRRSRQLLLFLYVDLIVLKQSYISELIFPVLRKEAHASISLRSDALLPWRAIGLDYLSGERVLRRDFLAEHLNVIAQLPGFGLESYINQMLIEGNSRVKVVRWAHVGHTYKSRKHGVWKGIAGEARMLMNIVETTSVAGNAHQIVEMRRHRV
jgi:hypothetical protein